MPESIEQREKAAQEERERIIELLAGEGLCPPTVCNCYDPDGAKDCTDHWREYLAPKEGD